METEIVPLTNRSLSPRPQTTEMAGDNVKGPTLSPCPDYHRLPHRRPYHLGTYTVPASREGHHAASAHTYPGIYTVPASREGRSADPLRFANPTKPGPTTICPASHWPLPSPFPPIVLEFTVINQRAGLPEVLLATTVTVLIAQPLGLLVEQNITTPSDVGDLRIARVIQQRGGSMPIHRVDTR